MTPSAIALHSTSTIAHAGTVSHFPRQRGGFLDKSISASDRMVVKRDGSKVRFDLNRVTRAISLSFFDTRNGGAANPARDDLLACFGLDPDCFQAVIGISEGVEKMLELFYRAGKNPTVEQVQDSCEKAIASAGYWDEARDFMAYRSRRSEMRLHRYEDNGLADYVAMSKYARYRADLGRRETFGEGVRRVRDMHLEHFSGLTGKKIADLPSDAADLAGAQANLLRKRLAGWTVEGLIEDVFARVEAKQVLPSMRSLQFGGNAVEVNNARMYNCCFSNVDRLEFFPEYLYLLLSGCGCGYSVQRQHVTMLPELPPRAAEENLPVWHYRIADSIEGWADAFRALIQSYYEGKAIEFSYDAIRPKGSPLKTSGGKAPGHRPLKRALSRIEDIYRGASGRKLKPIEIYDILCFAAKAVLSGGVRRSATICLFSPDDEEMMTAKTGNWLKENPQRSASNNSAVIPRGEKNEPLFRRLFESQKKFGEPGFYFCDNPDAGANPCVEIGMHPVVNWELSEKELSNLYAWGYKGDLPGTSRLSGWQHCNLTTINGAAITDEHSFYEACISAAIIGTLQAAYTKIDYLGAVTRIINEHDALLGVSICGMMDHPEVLFRPEVLTEGAHLARAANQVVAAAIGIRPAARVTCVKPEGTASLLLGSGSGIHPHHARRYFRHVQANRTDPIYIHFKSVNPQMTERSAYNGEVDDVIVFPVEAPHGAYIREDVEAIDFLGLVKLVQQAWVLGGTSTRANRSPDVRHNVSNTCSVKPDDWKIVADYIWGNREYFTGISLFADSGDEVYAQAPRKAVTTEMDIAKWNTLRPKTVDYTSMKEQTDETALKEVVACAGGSCEIV